MAADDLLQEVVGAGAPPAPGPTQASSAPPAPGVDVGMLQSDPTFQRLAVSNPDEAARVMRALGAEPPPVDDPRTGIVGRFREAFVDPALRVATGNEPGPGQATADVVSLGSLLGAGLAGAAVGGPAGAAFAAAPVVGPVIKGALDDWGVSHGWANAIGFLADLGTTFTAGRSLVAKAAAPGRAAIQEAVAGGAVPASEEAGTATATEVLSSKQRIAQQIIDEGVAAIEARKKPLSDTLEALEKGLASEGRIDPDHPWYAQIEDAVSQLPVGSPLISKLRDAFKKEKPIDLRDVVRLRSDLYDAPVNSFANITNPNLPTNIRLVGRARSMVTGLISDLLGPDGQAYNEALLAWKTQVRDPQRVLRSVFSNNLSPSTAFELMFSPNAKPEVLSTLAQLRDVSPDFNRILRLGAMQHLFAAAGGNIMGNPQASAAIAKLRPALESAGLFSSQELDSLMMLSRPGVFSQVVHSLSSGSLKPLTLGVLGGAAAAGGLTGPAVAVSQLAHSNPAFFTAAALAGGGGLALRRLALATPGSPAAKAAAADVVQAVAQVAQSLAQRSNGPNQF